MSTAERNTRFRYEGAQTWYKGNTHIHTTRSDGGFSPQAAAERYAGAGYDFIFFTDHWVASQEHRSRRSYPLQVFDGIELDGTDSRGSYYHVVCLGRFPEMDRSMGLEPAMQVCRDHDGFVIAAHPFWTGNSPADVSAHGFDAMESYNHVCHWLNGKGNAGYLWETALSRNVNMLGIACDDAHMSNAHPGWNGGWIMASTPECTFDGVMQSLRAGTFYGTQGPEIHRLEVHGNSVHVDCSPARFARFVGRGSIGARAGSFEGPLCGHFEIEMDERLESPRLEIEDDARRTAWTNTLFAPERQD